MDGIVIVAIAQEGLLRGTGTENQSPLVSEVTESFLVPYINYLTFGIDIAAGLIIGLSAIRFHTNIVYAFHTKIFIGRDGCELY